MYRITSKSSVCPGVQAQFGVYQGLKTMSAGNRLLEDITVELKASLIGRETLKQRNTAFQPDVKLLFKDKIKMVYLLLFDSL